MTKIRYSKGTARSKRKPATSSPSRVGSIARIVLDEDVHRRVDQAIAALVRVEDLYQRGGRLVRATADGRMVEVEPRAIPDLLSTVAECLEYSAVRGKLVARRTPGWLANAIIARGEWPGVRPLRAIAQAPYLRPDGTLVDTIGYDPATERLLVEVPDGISVPRDADRDVALAALRRLTALVADFPWKSDADRAVWLALLLTYVGRAAIKGPTPLMLFDAENAGVGKSLLVDAASTIAYGCDAARSMLGHDRTESTRRFTSIALGGMPAVLFDNQRGVVDDPALEAALTATSWTDRRIGKSEMAADIPYFTVHAMTGNNVALAGDSPRRVVRGRLESGHERPEDRGGFRHPNLLAHVREHRGAYLSDALTILIAHARASRPSCALVPLGSYEEWSSVARHPLVWLGQPDPCAPERREALRDDVVDHLAVALEIVDRVATWRGGPVTTAEIIGAVSPGERAQLEELCDGRFTPGTLSRRLGSYRERVLGGRRLKRSTRGADGLAYRVERVTK